VHNVDLFLAHYGYFAIFTLLMLGIVGPLIPDDSILVLSGIAIHRGQLDFLTVLAVAYAGSLCGITVSYLLGRSGVIYALERFPPLHRWVERHVPRTRRWFERYGKWTLFFGYFVAGLRHFTALTAGISGLRYPVFAAFAYPGGLAWVVSFVSIGYFAGSQWSRIEPLLTRDVLIAAAVAAVIVLIVWRVRRIRTAR
jgi:membrane protein DedA with SNARE-associated domain